MVPAALGDEGPERRLLRTAADEGGANANAAQPEPFEGLEEDVMALGGHQATGADELKGTGDGTGCGVAWTVAWAVSYALRHTLRGALRGARERSEDDGVDAQADDLKLAPLRGRRELAELAAAEVADAEHEAGLPDFVAEPVAVQVEQLLGTMHGERVWDAPGDGGEQADRGDRAAEVDMQMFQLAGAQPIAHQQRLREIKEPEAAAAQREAAQGEDGAETANDSRRMRADETRQASEILLAAGAFDVRGGFSLCCFLRGQLCGRAVRRIDGDGLQTQAAGAKAENLLEKKRVRDGRILTEQVADAGP